MSLNTSHASYGVLIYANEYILLHIEKVSMKFICAKEKAFEGTKNGWLYMTSHRLIFNNEDPGDLLQSLSAPYVALRYFQVMQPKTGSDYLLGYLRSQPNGNFECELKFKLCFEMGNISKFADALTVVCKLIKQKLNITSFDKFKLQRYEPSEHFTQASIAAFERPVGYFEWLPQQEPYSEAPLNFVYMTLDYPPFPGIGIPPPYVPAIQPQPIPTGTPCIKHEDITKIPEAIGFRPDIVARRSCIIEQHVPCSNLCPHLASRKLCDRGCADTNIWEVEVPSTPTISDF